MKIKNVYVIAIVFCLSILHSCKDEFKKPIEQPEEEKEIVSPYAQLLDKTPVYKDDVYSIYISSIEKVDKIIYLKEGALSDMNRESKFFLHIYPTDLSLLGENKLSNLSFDFENNPIKFSHMGKDYYVSETNLPNIGINKINTGQYAFRGDGSVNWSINKILVTEEMQPIITLNNDVITLRIKN